MPLVHTGIHGVKAKEKTENREDWRMAKRLRTFKKTEDGD